MRSIHDVSFLHCAQAEIIVNENFDKCKIYDLFKNQFVKVGDHQPAEDVPVLNVLAEKGLKVTVMSEFELLRRRIMDGMVARKRP